jgi:BT1 family
MTERQTYRTAAFVIVTGIVATTLAQPGVLASLPIRNLLKNELGLDRTASAAFLFWIGIAWYLKPFAGIITDTFPLFGTRRRSYLLISSILATLGWLSLTVTPHTHAALLSVIIGINTFMMLASTVTGGFLVETAQASAASGRLTALRQVVQQACSLVNAPLSGFLASIALAWVALASGAIVFLLVPVTIWFLHEPRHPPQPLSAVKGQLHTIAQARTMWAAAGLMLLFYIAPGASTAIFYKQQNELHMTTQIQGWIGFTASIAGVLTALLYGWACERLTLRILLFMGISVSTVINLLYLFYASIPLAFAIDTLNGFAFTLAELTLMDLAVRATPRGSEGLGYSLMLSVRNLALFGTDVLGSKLLDSYGWSFNSLVIANSVTTALALPFVFLLPMALVGRRDA